MEFYRNANILNTFQISVIMTKKGRSPKVQIHRKRASLKAISPLIATLILIAITIVGGVVVYRLFFSSSTAISSNVHVVVSDVSVSGAAGLSLNVKNDGGVAVTSFTTQVRNGTGTVLTPASLTGSTGLSCSVTTVTTVTCTGTLSPGQTVTLTASLSTPSVLVGGTYNIRITATGTGTSGAYVTAVDTVAIS